MAERVRIIRSRVSNTLNESFVNIMLALEITYNMATVVFDFLEITLRHWVYLWKNCLLWKNYYIIFFERLCPMVPVNYNKYCYFVTEILGYIFRKVVS